jgi:Pyruvate/2-oxoacid:ferredoxin oxidoreductase delta subunit
MSEAAPEISTSCPSDNVVVAEQDKKKKRRKRNNGSNSGAAVGGNASSIQETAPAKPEDKKVKEKKNEASKKGKKPSPEPMQPLATAKVMQASCKACLLYCMVHQLEHYSSLVYRLLCSTCHVCTVKPLHS